MKIKHIYWLAGLLDGEGYFGYQSTPHISISQVDLDIVEKAKNLFGDCPPIKTYHSNNEKHKTNYVLQINGKLAIQWMMTIYALMSIRRKSQIRNVIEKWNDAPNRQKGAEYCTEGHPLLIEGEQYRNQKNSNGKFTKICKICRDDYQIKSRAKKSIINQISKSKNISLLEAEEVFNKNQVN